MTISPKIRLSETLAYCPTDEVPSEFSKRLERLAIDGQLELHGQHIWIINEFEEQVSGWQLIEPAGLVGVKWDWSADLIRFEPNERPDFGVNPRYFRNVSFVRAELFDWLEPQTPAASAPKPRARGRPPRDDWKDISSIATALATKGFESENKFLIELIGVLEEQDIKPPGKTTLKTHKLIKPTLALAVENGRKMSD